VSTAPVPFDIADDLPAGLTLLEASAGTGKTFAIAALVARYVADGVPLADLLIITFTRAATGELRDRVRQRLVQSLRSVDAHLAGHPVPGDVVDRCLTAGPTDVVAERGRHLAGALADFDRATIVTTHAFCEDVLRGLGTTGDVDRDVTFLEDPGDLLAEVVDDLYLRKFSRTGSPAFSRADGLAIARAATGALEVDLEPVGAAVDSPADLRRRFAGKARDELIRRKRRANTLGYDDILTSLAQTLEPPGSPRATAAARRLQDRYRVVLVDEFQDTDPVQWRILQRGFAAGSGSTLVLVGDPKQAIYSFRGADVWTYLEAARHATDRRTLGVNWRTDQGLLDGIGALMEGAALGHPEIVCRRARAADANQAPRLVGAPSPAPLRVRVLRRNDPRLEIDTRRQPTVASVRQLIAADLAADVVGLLDSGASLIAREASGDERRRDLRPGDVAVLVGTNRQAGLIRGALEEAGVPAVINGGGNVFATPVALQWLQLLEALERPSYTNRARSAALTMFLGWDAARLASAAEGDLDRLQARLHDWAAVLERQGVAALVELVTVGTGLPGRVLARSDGERALTDLRHVGELLHAEAVASHLGVASLTAWLRRRIREGQRTDAAEERSRRLESDAAAVQVLTIHRSKGLEFPVVYLPDLADHVNPYYALPAYHDPATGRRTLDVGGADGPDHKAHRRRFEEEELGEDLRQAYVALTRAGQQAVLWWGPFKGPGSSPLGCLLLGRRDATGVITPVRDVPSDDSIVALLGQVAARAPGCVAVEAVDHAPAVRSGGRDGRQERAGDLEARHFDRDLDTVWRRTSYTAITAGAHEGPGAPVASEPERAVCYDEALLEGPFVPTAHPLTADGPGGDGPGGDRSGGGRSGGDGSVPGADLPSPMSDLPRGPAFGIVVHGVLETVDFTSGQLRAELEGAVRRQARFAPTGLDPLALADALATVIDTPLGPLGGDRPLRQVARADRLDELGFELPLAGGDRPRGRVGMGEVADLLRRWSSPGEPLAAYPDRLAALGDAELRGYLTGSIDLLLRVRPDPDVLGPGSAEPAGSPPPPDRFVVVDYKTNWLGPPDGPLTVDAYAPPALAEAMMLAHYPLQAVLYAVAAHRYLRWRLAAYEPGRHLGGVLYLFLRGMAGADTPRTGADPCGVFSWRPPAGLVVALSDLLDRGEER
jgi:exodeoxyribonuclease V beta subunit